MKISMQGVSYFSYKLYEQELKSSIIQGIFAQHPVNQDTSHLYINMKTDFAYIVEEYNNQIIISYRETTPSNDKVSYFAR